MRLEDHVLKAIDAFERGEKDHALMHASISIDATAKNLFPNETSGKKAYKKCIRQYWWLIERFIGEGLNLEDTKFTNLKLDNGYGKFISEPDLADVIYHIFRCNHAHAKEVPVNYELLPSTPGYYPWKIDRVNNGLQMPDTVIWALLAISVFCEANANIKISSEHFLSWGNNNYGIIEFKIKDYWGKEDLLKQFFQDKPSIRVKLDKL